MDSPEPDTDDLTLMQRLQGGDDKALDSLMGRYREPLFRYLYRFTNNATDAADLLEETFVKLYFHRDQFRPGSAFQPWLYTIAANLARDWLRKRKRRPPSANTPFSESAASADVDSPNPADDAVRVDDARHLREAIDRLPHKLRLAVILFHLEEKTHEETAALLQCTRKAVETRLYQARKRLQISLR